jgi:general secretion pathway protein A
MGGKRWVEKKRTSDSRMEKTVYQEFYGFREKPFALTPDPEFFYLSETHWTALESLLYGIQQRVGFMVVTGEIGTGKTTLGRVLLEKLDKKVRTAVIFNSFLTEGDLLKVILQDFGFPSRGRSKKDRMDVLNLSLVERLSEGENAVLIIDEAQNLSVPVLEQIRMLSNLETEKEKILQIILMGQPELNQKLQSPALEQLNQRIAIRHHLQPLPAAKTEEYIHHRLRKAGAQENITFSKSALKSIHQFSRGTPRLINLLCDRALLAGFMEQTHQIDGGIMGQAAKSLQGKDKGIAPGSRSSWPSRLIRWGSALFLIFLFFTVGVYLGYDPIFSWVKAKNFLGTQMPRLASLASGGPEKLSSPNPTPELRKKTPEAREGGEFE